MLGLVEIRLSAGASTQWRCRYPQWRSRGHCNQGQPRPDPSKPKDKKSQARRTRPPAGISTSNSASPPPGSYTVALLPRRLGPVDPQAKPGGTFTVTVGND